MSHLAKWDHPHPNPLPSEGEGTGRPALAASGDGFRPPRAGMTGEKGVGGFLETRRIGSGGTPPARPFDGAQGERPRPRDGITPRRTPKAHLQHLSPVLGVGDEGGGLSRDGTDWQCGAAPARPFDGAPASADLREGERPCPRDGIMSRRIFDRLSWAGMTGEKGVWGFLGTRRICSAGPPPARPFDGALGERPRSRDGFTPRRTPQAHLQHVSPALGVGDESGGNGWVAF